MAPAPLGEPSLSETEAVRRAFYATAWASESWEEATARRNDIRKRNTRERGAAFVAEHEAGNFDLIDARGFQGPLTEAYLPDHYRGSIWQYRRTRDDVFEVWRLPYAEYKVIYEESWEAKGIVDPHRLSLKDYR